MISGKVGEISIRAMACRLLSEAHHSRSVESFELSASERFERYLGQLRSKAHNVVEQVCNFGKEKSSIRDFPKMENECHEINEVEGWEIERKQTEVKQLCKETIRAHYNVWLKSEHLTY